MSGFCSRGASLLCPRRDLPQGPLHVFREHLAGRMPALCGDFPIGHVGIARLGKSAMAEGRERQLVPKARRADDLFDRPAHLSEIALVGGPRSLIAPVAPNHESTDALALDRVEFLH